jgi:hypothetical protein
MEMLFDSCHEVQESLPSDEGIVRPRAWAVLTSMTSLHLVGSSMRRSTGPVLFKILYTREVQICSPA